MSHIDIHCADCKAILGDDFWYVHRWLDEFYPIVKDAHRKIRHHIDGVEEARRKWGDEAAKAATIHIEKDCGGKVPTVEEAKTWSLIGKEGSKDGSTFLTDE